MGRRTVGVLMLVTALGGCAHGTDAVRAPGTTTTSSPASTAGPPPSVSTSDGVTVLGAPPWPEQITVRVGDVVEFPGNAQEGWTRQDGAPVFPSGPVVFAHADVTA